MRERRRLGPKEKALVSLGIVLTAGLVLTSGAVVFRAWQLQRAAEREAALVGVWEGISGGDYDATIVVDLSALEIAASVTSAH